MLPQFFRKFCLDDFFEFDRRQTEDGVTGNKLKVRISKTQKNRQNKNSIKQVSNEISDSAKAHQLLHHRQIII